MMVMRPMAIEKMEKSIWILQENAHSLRRHYPVQVQRDFLSLTCSSTGSISQCWSRYRHPWYVSNVNGRNKEVIKTHLERHSMYYWHILIQGKFALVSNYSLNDYYEHTQSLKTVILNKQSSLISSPLINNPRSCKQVFILQKVVLQQRYF